MFDCNRSDCAMAACVLIFSWYAQWAKPITMQIIQTVNTLRITASFLELASPNLFQMVPHRLAHLFCVPAVTWPNAIWGLTVIHHHRAQSPCVIKFRTGHQVDRPAAHSDWRARFYQTAPVKTVSPCDLR